MKNCILVNLPDSWPHFLTRVRDDLSESSTHSRNGPGLAWAQ